MSKTIYKSVGDWFKGNESVRVALVGSRYSGKSVFLTSLASQLLNHDEKNCPLGGWKVSDDQGAIGSGAFPDFKYEEARQMFAENGEWPSKTVDCSVWRRNLKLVNEENGKRKVKRVYLEVMDFPGERVADLSMKGRSYREWCKWAENSFGGVDGYTKNFGKYVEAIKLCGDYNEIVAAYKRFIADELAMFALSITPSIVKLDRTGRGMPRCRTSDEYLEAMKDRPLGLSWDFQFAPVPQSWFEDQGRRGITAKFKKGYDKYKDEVVSPIADWLMSVNQVYYFVDVLGLLSRGPDVYNGELSFATAVLSQFGRDDSGNPIVRRISNVFSRFIKTTADGVYVVATKIDRVLPGEDLSNVEALAKKMLGKVLDSLNVESAVYTCAAVNTTTWPKEDGVLQGRVRNKEGQIVECKYRVAHIPNDWPETDGWKNGNLWPETFPMFSKFRNKPPRQNGLDVLIKKMFSL